MTIILLSLNGFSIAQSSPSQPSDDSLSTAIRLNPLRLFTGTFQLEYEQQINQQFTLNVSGLGTYATRRSLGDPYLKTQELSYTSQSTGRTYYYNPQMISGWGVIAQLRHYLLKSQDQPVGFYAAPQLMYRKVWLTGRQYGGGYRTFEASNGFQDITRNLDVFSGGVLLGGQLGVIKNIYTIDFHVGAMMRLASYGGRSSTTKYKKWTNIDYSGVLPTGGVSIGILK